MNAKKILIRGLSLGILMIIISIIIWQESSFIIAGLGLVVIGVTLMLYLNKIKK